MFTFLYYMCELADIHGLQFKGKENIENRACYQSTKYLWGKAKELWKESPIVR